MNNVGTFAGLSLMVGWRMAIALMLSYHLLYFLIGTNTR
jgi:hypothetical protein